MNNMKSINLKKLPFLIKAGFFISNIGYIIHNYGFKEAVSKIWQLIKTSSFKWCYKHSKLFRKRVFKNLSKHFTDPFCVYLMVQLASGNIYDLDDYVSEDCVNQYISENNVSKEDAIKIKSKLQEFKNFNEAQS